MKIIVKRVIREYKPAEIWRIEILTTIEHADWFFLTRHEPTQQIGEAIEMHLKMLKEAMKRKKI